MRVVVSLRWFLVSAFCFSAAIVVTWFVAFHAGREVEPAGVELFTDRPNEIAGTPRVTFVPTRRNEIVATLGITVKTGGRDVRIALGLIDVPVGSCVREHALPHDAPVKTEPLKPRGAVVSTTVYSDIDYQVNRITCTLSRETGQPNIVRRSMSATIAPDALYAIEAVQNRHGFARQRALDIEISCPNATAGSLQFSGGSTADGAAPDEPVRRLSTNPRRVALSASWDDEGAKRLYDVMLVAIGALLGLFASAFFAGVQPIVDGWAERKQRAIDAKAAAASSRPPLPPIDQAP